MILLLLSFLLDSILSNYFPYSILSLTWFQPCFYVITMVSLYFYHRKKDDFFQKGMFYTIIGSLLFGNSLITRVISYLCIYIFLNTFSRKYHFHMKTFLLAIILSLLIHFGSSYLIFIVSKKITFSFILFLWQYIHYLLFNMILGIIIYYFFGINKQVR